MYFIFPILTISMFIRHCIHYNKVKNNEEYRFVFFIVKFMYMKILMLNSNIRLRLFSFLNLYYVILTFHTKSYARYKELFYILLQNRIKDILEPLKDKSFILVLFHFPLFPVIIWLIARIMNRYNKKLIVIADRNTIDFSFSQYASTQKDNIKFIYTDSASNLFEIIRSIKIGSCIVWLPDIPVIKKDSNNHKYDFINSQLMVSSNLLSIAKRYNTQILVISHWINLFSIKLAGKIIDPCKYGDEIQIMEQIINDLIQLVKSHPVQWLNIGKKDMFIFNNQSIPVNTNINIDQNNHIKLSLKDIIYYNSKQDENILIINLKNQISFHMQKKIFDMCCKGDSLTNIITQITKITNLSSEEANKIFLKTLSYAPYNTYKKV